ncbi:hypothetical protein [Phaeobacter porticola]|uniref:Uncharacterized protein n=1 Tax=Phaeobacter porticola TaxID=1844006 RepID=A0A1L3I5H1_9RHOB|nr:hypothetical protein [Phaeobacter porticola]APG47355.1 hypothetical protein PhaeoP97_01947 [Phaeobacter porticola]
MKTLIKAAAAITCLFGAAPVVAAPVTYDCEITSYEKYGWLSPRVLVFVDHEEKVTGVMDGIIASVQKTPMIVPYDQRSKNRLKLKWTVNNIDARSGSAKASYSATMDEPRMKLSITARVHGYDNRPSGSGPCKRSNIKLRK